MIQVRRRKAKPKQQKPMRSIDLRAGVLLYHAEMADSHHQWFMISTASFSLHFIYTFCFIKASSFWMVEKIISQHTQAQAQAQAQKKEKNK